MSTPRKWPAIVLLLFILTGCTNSPAPSPTPAGVSFPTGLRIEPKQPPIHFDGSSSEIVCPDDTVETMMNGADLVVRGNLTEVGFYTQSYPSSKYHVDSGCMGRLEVTEVLYTDERLPHQPGDIVWIYIPANGVMQDGTPRFDMFTMAPWPTDGSLYLLTVPKNAFPEEPVQPEAFEQIEPYRLPSAKQCVWRAREDGGFLTWDAWGFDVRRVLAVWDFEVKPKVKAINNMSTTVEDVNADSLRPYFKALKQHCNERFHATPAP
nr:hypothetical protein [bacterium]